MVDLLGCGSRRSGEHHDVLARQTVNRIGEIVSRSPETDHGLLVPDASAASVPHSSRDLPASAQMQVAPALSPKQFGHALVLSQGDHALSPK